MHKMIIQVRKVDAKSRVVLPEQFAGKTVTVDCLSDCEVRIRLAKEPRGRPSLSSLLARITEQNVHPAVEFGPPAGEEAV